MNHVTNTLKLFLVLSCILISTSILSAQQYKSSLGIRLGTYVGATFTTYTSTNGSVEAIAGITREANQTDYVVGFFYKHHAHLTDVVPTLSWYAGLGFLAFLEEDAGEDKFNIAPGVIIGMEYALEYAPVNFFLDVSPLYKVNSNSSSKFGIQASLGARYIFGHTQN